MLLEAEDIGAIRVVHVLAERIDAAATIEFKDAMRAVTAGAPGRILLNLGQVGFVDSSGLGAIVAVMKHLEAGQELELVRLNPTVDTVFRLTRMDTIFRIHDTLDAGIAEDA
ncbi:MULTISPECIES: STAS domain-containing protein [unclassified Roseivivax]|uniref:STAS domain-containing protein n=1 Tax=Roseivivax sp. GX 12232 TaxID=2900547 RepID=UPI001E46F581|nr:STAS domain-containing protein [Roseivivax sp. GX 12232]MCE0506005.1 STAS domain-containing protein [Roseivivax sp. GX 12232]